MLHKLWVSEVTGRLRVLVIHLCTQAEQTSRKLLSVCSSAFRMERSRLSESGSNIKHLGLKWRARVKEMRCLPPLFFHAVPICLAAEEVVRAGSLENSSG